MKDADFLRIYKELAEFMDILESFEYSMCDLKVN